MAKSQRTVVMDKLSSSACSHCPIFLYGVSSINSSKMSGTFHVVLNFNRLFLKLNGSSITNCRFSPIIGREVELLVYCNTIGGN